VQQSVSPEQLKQRRRELRQQRRVRAVKSIWRFACMSGLLVGIVWLVNQPEWTLSKPEQVRIEGNRFLTEATVRSILAIPYPQFMMELSPEQLSARLLERGSMTTLRIDRGLLPPRLLVRVSDLPPVARIVENESSETQKFVDARGLQLPIASYRSIVQQSPPNLRLRVTEGETCPGWTQLYRSIQTSPVAIGIVDCRNPQNLFLQTEVGKVRLGSIQDESRLNAQIQKLDRLRDWKQSTPNAETFEYLDLENPDSPHLQLKPFPRSTPASSRSE
jgi:cell division protein FtsQ